LLLLVDKLAFVFFQNDGLVEHELVEFISSIALVSRPLLPPVVKDFREDLFVARYSSFLPKRSGMQAGV
jgi:hypothetical protein